MVPAHDRQSIEESQDILVRQQITDVEEGEVLMVFEGRLVLLGVKRVSVTARIDDPNLSGTDR
jgi:hypothetical protein